MSKNIRSDSQADQIQRLDGLLFRLGRNLRAFDASDQACCGVTMAQCHALLAFDGREEIAMADLANNTGLAISTVTRVVDSLVEGGLVERRRPADDRRVVLVCLVDKGREQFRQIQRSRHEYLATVLSEIPEDRQREVVDMLRRLLGALTGGRATCCEKD